MAQIIAAVGPGWYPRPMPEAQTPSGLRPGRATWLPPAPLGARRPRPVADVPPAALADGDAAAMGWVLALLAARPLRDAPTLPMAELAAEGPALCAVVLLAVGSDAALADLDALGAHAGALAGAGDAASAVAAVGHLRGALWESLVAAMAPLDAPTTAALAERLAFVCDTVAVAAVRGRDFRVHDVRGDWRGAIERHVAAGRPFALLAIEANNAARLMAADADDAGGALAGVVEAVRGELRPGDVLGREADGCLRIVATGDGRDLAERVAAAVAAGPPVRGAPLTVSIGIAASPADGADADGLAAHADEALFAARAAGVPLA
jgi:GGDEF domain-containing protein